MYFASVNLSNELNDDQEILYYNFNIFFQHLTECFIQPFLNNKTVFIQNLITIHDLHKDKHGKLLLDIATFQSTNEKAKPICNYLTTRFLIGTKLHAVVKREKEKTYQVENEFIDEKSREILNEIAINERDFIIQQILNGLCSQSDLKSLMIVNDIYDYDEILYNAKNKQKVVYPYNPTPDFYKYCQKFDVEMIGISRRELMTHINKEQFRNLVHKVDPKFDYKHHRLQSTDSLEKIQKILHETETYKLTSLKLNNNKQQQTLMFIQEEMSAGGVGSYMVTKKDNIYEINDELKFHSLDEIATFFKEKNVDIIVAPYYEYKHKQPPNPSIGIILTDTGVSAYIVGNQRLDANGAYFGIDISPECFTPDIKTYFDENYQRLLAMAIRLAQHEQQMGRRGYGSIDAFMYVDNKHELRVGISEENARFTGVCPTLMTAFGHEKMREFILKHQQFPCMLSNDDVIIRSQSTSLSTTDVAKLFGKHDIPLFTKDNLEGVLILSCPMKKDDYYLVALAIIALTIEKRKEIEIKINNVTKSKF